MLDRAAGVFYNLSATDTNDEMQKIEREVAPRFAKHSMRVYQNAKLFRRVDALMKRQEQPRPHARSRRGCWSATTAASSVPAPALDAKARKRMAAIAERLATLGTKFSQNVLADEQDFLLVLESEAELAGLPDAVRAAAAQTASERGHKGKHAISLSRSSIEPFLQFSARRDLREQAFKAWRQRGANGGKTDNRKIVAEILSLRAERSRLLGFKTAADAALEFTMAKTPGQRAQAADGGVGAGARARGARSAKRCSRPCRPRAATSSSRAGTGATTPRRCARPSSTSTRRRSSPTCSSTASSRRRSTWPPSCSA